MHTLFVVVCPAGGGGPEVLEVTAETPLLESRQLGKATERASQSDIDDFAAFTNTRKYEWFLRA